MRKILLFLIVVFIIFSGVNQLKNAWNDNSQSLDGTYKELKDGVLNWYESASLTGKELKKKLNSKIEDSTAKYNSLKEEVKSITEKVEVKTEQLDQTLKEIEEAKEALDRLLEREPVTNGEVESTVSNNSSQ